uniref:AlNc14C40G3425 protein n=1 Tax=Albugo laibachii Nc14 TaxID=890382 RepID=F0W9G6_9STRA|nr:AlNc14C40G3425 [Albugo laibachii Nc14]|eukprot:CCA17780.1 AlNc14C40G3425 [Albugo laibachii Nc14]
MLLEHKDHHSPAKLECNNRNSIDESPMDSFIGRKKRADSVLLDEKGLSGFLDHKNSDGSWQSLLFQTYGFSLTVYRSNKCPPQSPILVTDLRRAKEIKTLDFDAQQIQLRTEGECIILRAVTEEVARFWVEGLQHLQKGITLKICHERTTFESEDDLYDQIDTLASSRLSHIRIDRPKDHPWMEKESCMCGLRSASICYSANQRAILRTHSDFNALEMVQGAHKCGCIIC